MRDNRNRVEKAEPKKDFRVEIKVTRAMDLGSFLDEKKTCACEAEKREIKRK